MLENATNLTNTTILSGIWDLLKTFILPHWEVIAAAITSVGVMWMIFNHYFQRTYEWAIIQKDKKEIYDWLYDKTKHLMPNTVGSPFDTTIWPSTEEISSALDLREERVHSICTSNKRIQRQEKGDLWPNQELEERWAVRKFVRDDD